ncbi:hypothetical protein [Capsulimonas corticalis]|nr:hypothetical protein [Capsulimonas corticalis]
MQTKKRRTTADYAQQMPMTYTAAMAIFESVVDPSVWGKHLVTDKPSKFDDAGRSLQDVSWKTIIAGKWIDGKNGKRGFPQQPMKLLDVIKTLADPDHCSIGNIDRWDRDLTHYKVRHIRIDIDLDRVFERDDIEALRSEIQLVKCIFAEFALEAHVMRTGNRGIQVTAPIRPLPLQIAAVLVEAIQSVLRSASRYWIAKDFQSNLDGILRLPLGRHAWSKSISWMLGDDGSILPLEEQINAVQSAFGRNGDLDDTWTHNITEIIAKQRHNTSASDILAALAYEMPAHPLIEAWRRAKSLYCKDESSIYAQPSQVIQQISTREDSKASIKHIPRPHGAPINKTKAWQILNAGFEPGESYAYYTNQTFAGVRGKDAIGCAITAFGGNCDLAREWLEDQARSIPGSTERAISDRLGLIGRLIYKNNTYERLQKQVVAKKSKDLAGEVLAEETLLANQIVAFLPGLRKASSCRTKTFQPQALVTIRHILELMQLACRITDDGLIDLSFRTLDAAIKDRWPEHATSAMDVSRQMEWIVEGERCLFQALRVKEMPTSKFDPIRYALGNDFIAILDVVDGR